MNEGHPHPSELESYAIGIDDGLTVEAIESHLRSCASCTDELRRQAQLELALAEVAPEGTFCGACQALRQHDRCQACGAAATVNGFQILRVLVQNAHGRMYLARDPHGQVVALKELAFVQPPHSEVVDAFEREARLLRQLAHPDIPRFVDAFAAGEGINTRLYLAQEFVEGESLAARLARHQFSEQEVREIARQVLDILVYLQSLSPMVFHRDIKPANLVRRPDGRITLVDFGAARDLGATAGATLVGTFGYMPIEQLGGLVDATTDLYALGATLVHLLSRREPWKLLQQSNPLDGLNVSPRFRGFLARLLAREPGRRYPSALHAGQALRRLERPSGNWWPESWLPDRRLLWSAVALLPLAIVVWGQDMFRPQRAPAVPMAPLPSLAPEPAPQDRVMVAPNVGRAQLEIDPTQAPYRPELPDGTQPGTVIWSLVKVCASAEGAVTQVSSIKPASDPDVDRRIREAIRGWRYRPYLLNGRPTPFCTPVRIELHKR